MMWQQRSYPSLGILLLVVAVLVLVSPASRCTPSPEHGADCPANEAVEEPDPIAWHYEAKHLDQPPEGLVREAVTNGQVADLQFNRIPAGFLLKLLTGDIPGARDAPAVQIDHAVVDGELDLSYREIRPFVSLKDCRFADAVDFSWSTLDKGLNLSYGVFRGAVRLRGMEVKGPFRVCGARFETKTEDLSLIGAMTVGYLGSPSGPGPLLAATGVINSGADGQVDFRSLRAAHLVDVSGSRFANSRPVTFAYSRIGSIFYLNNVDVHSSMDCSQMQVAADAIFSGAQFHGRVYLADTKIAGNLDLQGIRFPATARRTRPSRRMDCCGTQVDGEIKLGFKEAPADNSICLSGTRYARLSPTAEARSFLGGAEYDPGVYAQLEDFLRKEGRPDDANWAGLLGAWRAQEELPLHHPLRWWKVLMILFVGAGYFPAFAVAWSAIVIGVGAFLFRPELMVPADAEAAGGKKGAERDYSRLWYSLDLFAPVIELGVRKKWGPHPDQKWLLAWMRVQMILGWIIVPIGLVALTGIMKH